MLMRALIKFCRGRIGRLDVDVPAMDGRERMILHELFTTKNYIPHDETHNFGSFSLEFKDYLFSMKAFCKAAARSGGVPGGATKGRPKTMPE